MKKVDNQLKLNILNLKESIKVEKWYFHEKALMKEISIYCFLKISYWSLFMF